MFVLFKKFPFFRRLKVKISGENNRISPSFSEMGGGLHAKTRIKICGNENAISIGENCLGRFNLMVFGDNNTIKFEDSVLFNGLSIYIGSPDSPCNNSKVYIGSGTTFSGPGTFRLMEHNSEIILGNDVMFSEHFDVWCSDTHAILDERGNAKNVGKSIKIGAHVWVGKDVKIGKNVEIPGGCVVGWGSVVSRKFSEKNAVIAGNPARVVKVGVHWVRETISQITPPSQ